MATKKVALYSRVSTDRQTTENQLIELRAVAERQGWEIVTSRDFPSNIRGEATCYTVRASMDKIYGLSDQVNILLAFDCEAILAHLPGSPRTGSSSAMVRG